MSRVLYTNGYWHGENHEEPTQGAALSGMGHPAPWAVLSLQMAGTGLMFLLPFHFSSFFPFVLIFVNLELFTFPSQAIMELPRCRFCLRVRLPFPGLSNTESTDDSLGSALSSLDLPAVSTAPGFCGQWPCVYPGL